MNGNGLPEWAQQLVNLYESNAASQFIVHGNVYDRLVIPAARPRLGALNEFLLDVLMPRFDVVLSYDLGNGIRVEKGGQIFQSWPFAKDNPILPKTPRQAIEVLTHYFRFCANLRRLNANSPQVGCFLKGADLIAPPLAGGHDYDLGAMITLIRDWANDQLLTGHALATFLIQENLNDLHPLLVNNPRAAKVKIPLPAATELRQGIEVLAPSYPSALSEFSGTLDVVSQQLAGATIGAVESLLKSRNHAKATLQTADLVKLKKQLVENDCNGLIEFIESPRSLEQLHGQEKVKEWLRQDIALWSKNDTAALPKGYLICGPVGTGKTFLVECLAGEAGVPVVKLKNFRDRWVGSTEGNLEKIFRLLQALGRCYVFVDEADQALGRRNSSGNDSGVSGRIYSMIAEEMGSSSNRGKLIWVLASSRPDLIEVDLKRPGRVDVKIPLLPTTTARESFQLLQALTRSRGIDLSDEILSSAEGQMPLLLTPGAAETLAVKIYRIVRTSNCTAAEALRVALEDYRSPVAADVMEFQIQLALEESSDPGFVPEFFRRRTVSK
ncbi:MAG: AAA family ATPase [Acidobacteriaceae bacterium]|nr:AAA family ATPase [Acidobacteriaceae bacterium]